MGLEPIAEQAAVARRSGDDAVVEGYFPDALAGSDERFDCIVLNDVLEHLLGPWWVVADLGGCWQRTAESPPFLVFSSFPCG